MDRGGSDPGLDQFDAAPVENPMVVVGRDRYRPAEVVGNTQSHESIFAGLSALGASPAPSDTVVGY